ANSKRPAAAPPAAASPTGVENLVLRLLPSPAAAKADAAHPDAPHPEPDAAPGPAAHATNHEASAFAPPAAPAPAREMPKILGFSPENFIAPPSAAPAGDGAPAPPAPGGSSAIRTAFFVNDVFAAGAAAFSAVSEALPPNVKLVTLTNNYAGIHEGKLLLRLSHLYEAGE
ncbi:MAG: hypothetical protein VXY90_14095, partial [Pseudomonadota bacterium]|nr:hypothetical protein [Pseudomonadota bacterium]